MMFEYLETTFEFIGYVVILLNFLISILGI